MPSFSYRVIDADGKERKGIMSAPAKEYIERKLVSEGLIIVDIDKDELLYDDSLFGRGRLTSDDFAGFTRQFTHFLNSGIGVINSLKLMEEQTDNRKMRYAISYLADQIQAGDSLSVAMNNSDIFPEPLVAVVEVGESKGKLSDYLEKMTMYFEKNAERDAVIKKSIIYPILMAIVVLCSIIGILVYAVPGFLQMLDGIDISLPTSTRIVAGICNLISEKWWLCLAFVILIAVLVIFISRSKTGRVFWSRWRLNYPGSFKRYLLCDCAKFSRIMSTMLYADIPLVRSLELAANQFQDHILFKKGILRVKSLVSAGGSLSNKIEEVGIFPKLLVNMISVGEESGSLKEMFESAAIYYEAEFNDAVRKTAGTVELVLIIILAAILGMVIMALLKPLIILYEAVGSM